MLTLFGDGIHDDTAAIQQLLDSGSCEVTLPAPAVCYLISKPLLLPSGLRLVLPRFAEVRLMDNSDCPMLMNKGAECLSDSFVNVEFVGKDNVVVPSSRDIEIVGGIWNCNNCGQTPNPIRIPAPPEKHYNGFGMLFIGVERLALRQMTVKDPVNFAVVLDTVSHFEVTGITFDFNYGNPTAQNMDGIHLNGNCHYGHIHDLHGACYDDTVALNADEGIGGAITNIEIDNIFGTDSHSAVRLLTVQYPLENVHIHDIFGTFFQYAVGITCYYPDRPHTGHYAGIKLDNLYVSKAERKSIYHKDGTYVYPLIWVEGGVPVKDLTVTDIHRTEKQTAVATVYTEPDSVIELLCVKRIFTDNRLNEKFPTLDIKGKVGHLIARNIDE